MAMLPLESVNVSTPPLINSTYSPGGVGYNAVNQFNNTPIAVANQQYTYGNPYASGQYSMTPQTSSAGGGSIIGDANSLKSAGQFVGNGFSFPQSGFLNNIGTSLGFSSGAVTYPTGAGLIGPSLPGASAMGPFLPSTGTPVAGSLGISSTLSSTLGAAGLGALAGGFLGRIGGNSTGGSIGGAAGAAIGNAILPGIGGVIGGALGGTLGGFFGGKKVPTQASVFKGKLDESGTIGGSFYVNKNAKQYSSYDTNLEQEINGYLAQFKKQLPELKFKPETIQAGVNTRYSPSGKPGFLQIERDNANVNFAFDPDNIEERQKAIGQMAARLAKDSGATDEQIKAAADKVAYNMSMQGQVRQNMPFVPIKDNQRFADYMNKYKVQGTPNATT